MFDTELINSVMSSFNAVKDQLENLEKDYSQLVEKNLSRSQQEEESV